MVLFFFFLIVCCHFVFLPFPRLAHWRHTKMMIAIVILVLVNLFMYYNRPIPVPPSPSSPSVNESLDTRTADELIADLNSRSNVDRHGWSVLDWFIDRPTGTQNQHQLEGAAELETDTEAEWDD